MLCYTVICIAPCQHVSRVYCSASDAIHFSTVQCFYEKQLFRSRWVPSLAHTTWRWILHGLHAVACTGGYQMEVRGLIVDLLVVWSERTCSGKTDGEQGFIQSPNWPGLYPSNIECTWKITPEKGRRILVVVPEIYLAGQDKCRDSLVMRKSGTHQSSLYLVYLVYFSISIALLTTVAFQKRSRPQHLTLCVGVYTPKR